MHFMPWGHDAVMCNESWMMGWHYDIPGTAGVLYHAFGAHSVLPPMFCLRLPTDGLITSKTKEPFSWGLWVTTDKS